MVSEKDSAVLAGLLAALNPMLNKILQTLQPPKFREKPEDQPTFEIEWKKYVKVLKQSNPMGNFPDAMLLETLRG